MPAVQSQTSVLAWPSALCESVALRATGRPSRIQLGSIGAGFSSTVVTDGMIGVVGTGGSWVGSRDEGSVCVPAYKRQVTADGKT
ncbi:hypothetical protein MOX02_15330 [Methylobacterium oxalidis]|uniref:Uncharacterized protein n=1 Tax=Methylobacterium oxalidis TaxID=944322 RepID=A0A512J0P4_9HYPH|nr:hypothetical protein MOX02_15330 [Methylobacterium oxalidis]GLS66585.1 hypothetical protein GCM10007888_49680 [Methylobacterium oxalidis]